VPGYLGSLEDEQLSDFQMYSWVSVRTMAVFEGFDSNYVIYVSVARVC